ncbi:MAG TPA: response regulator transcription factor [Anaerolineales bacterium]|nr:response regulator transcription factor [Anaerolineae bacterium]HIQ01941.1 response regulator transcription factor [Anaerolineales bacterium]
MDPQILLVEGRRAKGLSCAPLLEKKGYHVTRVHTRRNANAWLEKGSPDLLIVDARHLRFNASRFCQALRANGNPVPLLLILPEGEEDPSSGATAILRGKLTSRKLFNRIRRILSGPGGEILRVGDIVLDVKRRTVSRSGQQRRLTPKQTHLLEVFMRNPGRVLTRAFLMKEVWNTDFVGDTRTLEVHIHWLRRAIEETPSNPVYLTTVRRLGYRFDVPQADPPGA